MFSSTPVNIELKSEGETANHFQLTNINWLGSPKVLIKQSWVVCDLTHGGNTAMVIA